MLLLCTSTKGEGDIGLLWTCLCWHAIYLDYASYKTFNFMYMYLYHSIKCLDKQRRSLSVCPTMSY